VKTLAVPPDAEHVVIDYLTTALAAHGQDVTCGVNIPTTWTDGTKPHVQVALDGTPIVTYPILFRASVRVTCWTSSTTAGTTPAKALAALCFALLCVHPGGSGVASIRPLTGVLPAQDNATLAQLASVSVQVNLLGAVVA